MLELGRECGVADGGRTPLLREPAGVTMAMLERGRMPESGVAARRKPVADVRPDSLPSADVRPERCDMADCGRAVASSEEAATTLS